MALVLEPGTLVAGRYRLDALLGQGGMGVVWSATHTVTRRAVAMKLIRGPAHERPELRRRFLREGHAAAAVRHPNVVEILDVFALDAHTPVIVMELLRGETLSARLSREQQLSVPEVARLLLPAISAVGTAHARGIVHRDLKPENIYLAATESGDVVKVLDFGIAKLTSAPGRGALATQAGSTLGTPCYMAPEQAAGEHDVDHRADIWALGVTLYECLSGHRPIEGECVGQVVMHLMTQGIAPLEQVTRGLPVELTTLINQMLSRERARRPEDLREVQRVLAHYSQVPVIAFGAPGSDVVAHHWDAPELVSDEDAPGVHRGSAEPIETPRFRDTTGPHALPSRRLSDRSQRKLLGWVGIGGLLAASVAVWRLAAEGPAKPPQPTRASAPMTAAAVPGAPTGSVVPSASATPTAVVVDAPAAAQRSLERTVQHEARAATGSAKRPSRRPAALKSRDDAVVSPAPASEEPSNVVPPAHLGGLVHEAPF